MMPTGWGFFPWPVLLVIPMIAMAVFTAVSLSQRRGPRGTGCGFLAPPPPNQSIPWQDQPVTAASSGTTR